MTQLELAKRREEIDKIFQELKSKASGLWLTFCVWIGPFGELNHREGYFTDITEAESFKCMLEETYTKKYPQEHAVYVNKI